MAEEINVGGIDGIIRIILGIACVGAVGYHFTMEKILSLYGLIPVIILILFFLKTGLTKVCPISKAFGINTAKKS